MKALLLFVLASMLAIGTVFAGTVPVELAGEWASPNAKFSHELLAHGTAIYLQANGFAAMFSADKTDILGMAGTATYNPKTFTLKLDLRDRGTQQEKVAILYDPKARTFTIKRTPGTIGENFTRRHDKVPKWVIDEAK